MADDVNQLLLQVDASVELARRNLRSLEGEVSKFQRTVQGSLDKADGNFNRFNANVSRSMGQFKGILAGAFSAAAMVSFGRSVVEVSTRFKGYEQALKIVTGSTQAAGAELEYVAGVAERVGFRVTDLTQAYVGLSAASRGTYLEGARTRDVFEALVSASAAYGLTSEQLSGALLAVQQIISKGTVSAEELRGQLGERLPGAFQVAARAMGVTTAELGDMLQKGEVLADDFLPKFAEQLRREIPAGTRAAGAGFAELANAWDRLKLVIGEDVGLFDSLASGANALAGAIASINAQIQGTQRIAAGRGFAGLFDVLTSSRQALEQASTPGGRAAQLRQNVGDLQAELRGELKKQSDAGYFGDIYNPSIRSLRGKLKEARAELADYLASAEYKQAKASFKGDFLSEGGGTPSAVTKDTNKTKAPKQTALEKYQDKTDYSNERRNEIQDFVKSTEEIDLANVRIGRTISFTEYLGESFGEVADIVDRDVRLAFEDLIDQQRELQEAAQEFARTFAGAFEDAILSGDLDGALDGLLEDIARLIIRLTVVEPLAKSVAAAISGSGGGGGFLASVGTAFGSIFGRASGGPISANRPYMVGERGPELIVPRMSAHVIPNNRLGGGGVTVNVDARGSTDPAMVAAAAKRAVYELAPAIITASTKNTMDRANRRPLPRGLG